MAGNNSRPYLNNSINWAGFLAETTINTLSHVYVISSCPSTSIFSCLSLYRYSLYGMHPRFSLSTLMLRKFFVWYSLKTSSSQDQFSTPYSQSKRLQHIKFLQSQYKVVLEVLLKIVKTAIINAMSFKVDKSFNPCFGQHNDGPWPYSILRVCSNAQSGDNSTNRVTT